MPPNKKVGPRDTTPRGTDTAPADIKDQHPNSNRAGRNGHEPNGLRSTIEAAGGSLKDWTVLSPQIDPFRLDTPANHRDGEWLAATMDRLGIGRIHNRGLHYALLTQPKPDGTSYATTDWDWLLGVSNVARWLGYVPFDQIVDQKNDPPVIRLWKPAQPKAYLSVDFEVAVPDADDLEPRVGVSGFAGAHPYHLALLGEKSSLEGVLGPIAQRYQADLYLPSGDISNTMIYTLAKTSEADGRPLVVLYFSDCDPSGWNMPIAVARKLLAFKIQQFPRLNFRCLRAALRPDQVRQHDLPISPVKEGDKRGAAWESKMGVQQTEIDAIATLQPQLLRRIAEEAIAPFFDRTLAARVEQTKLQWLERAQQALSEQTGDLEWLRADAARQLGDMRDQIRQLLDAVRVDPDSLDLPPVPEIPVAAVDRDREQPMPLCDSAWSFAEQTRRLIASKSYNLLGET